MGTELLEADCGKEAMQRNFTNEEATTEDTVF